MKVDQHFEEARQLFADQFEAEGDHYLYRRNMKEAPIQVSAAERDRYIEAYNKSTKISARLVFWAAIALVALFVTYSMVSSDLPEVYLYGGVVLIIAVSLTPIYWARSKPARELRGRGAVGEARSRAEMKALRLNRLTYFDLATAPMTGAVLLFMLSAKVDLLHGWNRLWLALIALIFVLTAVRAFQKWRFDSR